MKQIALTTMPLSIRVFSAQLVLIQLVCRLSIALLLVIFLSSLGIRQVISAEYNYPGGFIELQIPKINQEIPEVKFGLRDPVLIEESNHWRILVGLDLALLPGEYVVYFKHGGPDTSGEYLGLTVRQQIFPFTEISVNDENTTSLIDHYVSLPLNSLDFSNTQQPSLPMRAPLAGDWSDHFGHRWLVKGQTEIVTNNAISVWAPQYASVLAPQNAIISNIEMDEDALATVVLDHGRGLYSILRGLTDLTVDIGNGVVGGAVLGRLPSLNTDTAQGKLVWQTLLNGVFVDPSLLIGTNELDNDIP